MTPTPAPDTDEPTELRFPTVSRRAFLRRSALIGLAASAAPVLAACGGSPSTPANADTSPSTQGATGGRGDTTTPTAGTTGTNDPSTPTPHHAFPAGRQLQVDFTYEAGSGRVHSPYIAVWIEDAAGDLVQTVSLWYKSDESKYLRDLKRWSSKNNSAAVTTGATRIPGSFAVAWDGTDLDGTVVGAGDYFVCIEAAREDGPYQIIRELVTVDETLAPTSLTPNGELTAASVELVA